MKKRLPPFAAGMLTAALIGGLGLSALAATGQMTITVDPINIQVNGQTFQPKDVTGADVPVFAYNGTTYAPLRALAEAYGLEVGYDAQANMATVGAKAGNDVQPTTTASAADYSDWTAEEEAAYQEFKGLWKTENVHKLSDSYNATISYIYTGTLTEKDIKSYLTSLGKGLVLSYTEAIVAEIMQEQTVSDLNLWFFYDKDNYDADTVLWAVNYHPGIKQNGFTSVEWNVD